MLPFRRHDERTISALGFWICVVLIWIDSYYVATGQIGVVYLADTAVEAVVAAAWALTVYRRRHRAAPLKVEPAKDGAPVP